MAKPSCWPPRPTGPPRPGISDFFPLTCDYRERTAAAGKFPGGFLKREGRPTMKETLTSRLMDRPIRPLFPVVVPRRSADPKLRAGQRSAERRRRAGHERRLGRAGHLAAAVRRPDRLGPPGPHRRQVRPVPHAGRAGRERSRPDRLRQQGRGPDDRRLRPRNARRPMVEAMREAHRIIKSALRPAARADRQGRRREEAVRSSAGRRPARQAQEPLLRSLCARPSRPPASTPGPRPWPPSRRKSSPR